MKSLHLRSRAVRVLLALVLLLTGAAWPYATATADPNQGPGGPILVVTSTASPYGTYYAEILRTEGLNAFAVADISTVTPASLAAYDVMVLAKMPLSSAQVTMLSDWVSGGGNLIAMAPDPQLAGLLGLTPKGTTLSNGYLLVDTSTSPGNGIVSQTIQFHGSADRYTISNASRIATLYSDAFTSTGDPAVTLRSVASGKAAAFTYDLAASIIMTRQGNPAWAAQERDGAPPIRSSDKFFGNAVGDPQPDWVDLAKVGIPQADEQQRLLVNLILAMNASRKPLPRFWYFPNGKKAVIVMTGDDHGNGGTGGRFDQFIAASPAGCSLVNWECIRGTSYVYPGTPLSDAQAAAYNAQGFEVGLHVNTSCLDYTPASLESAYVQQIAAWRANYPSIPPPITQRHHCIVWSDWITGAQVQLNHGIRFDTSYYYWPPAWVNNIPGVYTGSVMPMRFAALDGTLVDVYQATSQMTDESGQDYPFTVDALLDRALGTEGYYGAYVINAHTDAVDSPAATATVASVLARGVPVVSSRQMMDWLDGRNASAFQSLAWSGTALSFTIAPGSNTTGLTAMLPTHVPTGALATLTRSGSAVTFAVGSIKGVEYATFPAAAGAYVATYASDTSPPTVTATSPDAGATGVNARTVKATFSKAMDPATLGVTTFELLGPSALVNATVSYDAGTKSAVLTPSVLLAASTTYTATMKGGATDPRAKDLAANALAANFVWTFTTGSALGCPCTAFDAQATPANASVADPNAVELGVKFTSDVSGQVTGIRFYKGAANTGSHVGKLWTASGQLLASATFTAETASGWQQVNFATPVPIAASTVYVASYFAPNGNYAANNLYFANSGVDKIPLHLLRDGASGGNGVYAYGAGGGFPNSTYQASNYWVDVVFSTGSTADTTPPTVTATSPSNGTTGVSTGAAVTATFSEAVDATTVVSSTFELRDAASALVPATVAYNAAALTATLTPTSPLAVSTTYTLTIRGGTTDPRVKDAAGNALAANFNASFTTAAANICSAPPNAIVAENCLPGNPSSEWDISGIGGPGIEGFATDISVNRGGTVSFKVNTSAANYRFDIYRMGYYGGMGARKVAATVLPTASLPQAQPTCLDDAATGLIDCGNWAVSGSWTVPANAVSGIYFAKAVRSDNQNASHIFFVVRNDGSTSHLLFQTSDTTWQAYNNYGGRSLYTGGPGTNPNRAYKVSYNRPFNTRIVDGGQDWVFNSEYPMVRWLESNGYDVSYATGVDSDRAGAQLLGHKVFLSVGHDEYWSGQQRANVEAARDTGVNLAFFSGNEVFWKTRWENSIDASGTPYRTLVSYKETHANAKLDTQNPSTWTGTWRDPRFSPPADGGRPENALTGTLFMINDGATTSITVPAADGKMRFWRNTSVATLATGGTATLPTGTLGYEWDLDVDNGSRPQGLIRLATTVVPNAPVLQDFGSTYAPGTATHSLTLYKHPSGARVFGAGTVQWSWGLDATHDRAGTPADVRMQQATVNLFADMGVQPATLQSGLIAATASTDSTAPSSTIGAPVQGATVAAGTATTISGTAADTGGGVVGGVEVSVNGGTSWHPAIGRASWTYSWTPTAAGPVTIKSRAIDDSGNLEVPGAGVGVTVGGTTGGCPCTIWPSSATPAVAADPDTVAVTLGVKFQADQAGSITAIRFYKAASNTGNHVVTLWSSTGQPLATATSTSASETASGWQQVALPSPVAVTANTTYVASYHTTVGHYSVTDGFFTAAVDNPPLHALRDGVSGANGVYSYGATSTFPTSTFQSANYWVDVVFTNAASDTTPPTIVSNTPTNGATGISRTTTVTATFSEAMDPATIGASTFELRDAANVVVTSNLAYDPATRTATLTPGGPLAASTVYTANVKGGAVDPRVKDTAGNALAATLTWSFTTTANTDVTPPTVTGTVPASGAVGVAAGTTISATFSEALDAATVVAGTYELRNAANALVTATIAYNAGTQTATLTPSAALASSTTYTATVRGGTVDPRIKDVAGNALAANVSWSFTTVDTTPPTVTTLVPASNATNVSSATTVRATFSEAMDAATIGTTTFELRDPVNNLVTAAVTYDPATRIATLTPGSPLAAATKYTATVKGGAVDPRVKDVAGNALAANRTWSFTIDATPPTVTAITPASGATNVSPVTTVTATFSEAMNAATIDSTTVLLASPSATVPATVAYNATNRRATLTPASPLAAGVSYTVTVKGGATDPRVKDVAGNALATDRTWSFVVDTTPPTVTAITPASGATAVVGTTTVTATFSEAMDVSTIDGTTIVLNGPAGGAVPATVAYNPTNRRATLTPSASLTPLTTFTAIVRGGSTGPRVRDVAGNPLATDRTWSFTTR